MLRRLISFVVLLGVLMHAHAIARHNGVMLDAHLQRDSLIANLAIICHPSGTGVVDLINSTTTGRRFTLPTSLVNHPFSGTFNVGAYVNLATADQSSGTNQLGVGSTVNVADTGSVYLDRNGIYRTTFNLSGPGNGAGSAGVMTLEIEQG